MEPANTFLFPGRAIINLPLTMVTEIDALVDVIKLMTPLLTSSPPCGARVPRGLEGYAPFMGATRL